MTQRLEFVRQRRQQAWAFGRRVRDELVSAYTDEYRPAAPPAPALIIDELITDFLGAKLAYDPLPDDVFAETEWSGTKPVVTVNSLTGSIGGVRDAEGTQNVAKWHEAIHIVEHGDVLRAQQPLTLLGFETPSKIVCHRSPGREKDAGRPLGSSGRRKPVVLLPSHCKPWLAPTHSKNCAI